MSLHRHLAATVALLLAPLGLGVGCAGEGRVVYTLAWNLDRVELHENRPGWAVTTDLGYRVEVDAGYLSSHSAELLVCERRVPILGFLHDALAPKPVHATHALAMNPSAFHQARIESLVEPRARSTERPLAAGEAYCGAQYLIARPGGPATGLPYDVDMTDLSLFVRGHVSSADGDARAFEVRTRIANGRRLDSERLDAGGEAIAVFIERRLGALFDGVDFDTQPPRMWERRMLVNLIDTTRLEIRRPGAGEVG